LDVGVHVVRALRRWFGEVETVRVVDAPHKWSWSHEVAPPCGVEPPVQARPPLP